MVIPWYCIGHSYSTEFHASLAPLLAEIPHDVSYKFLKKYQFFFSSSTQYYTSLTRHDRMVLCVSFERGMADIM